MRWLLVVLLCMISSSATSRDLGQWENTNPKVREWYKELMMPDVPTGSCCGEADAYWCDDYFVRSGKAYCKITDDRPDAPLGRPHRNIGEEFEIPDNKLKWGDIDPQPRITVNPTGHGILFLSTAGYVYCFVAPGGV